MKKYMYIGLLIFYSIVCFLGGLYVGKTRGIPFTRLTGEWSIGIYEGNSSLNFYDPKHIKNPVLTKESVTDVQASFVADPFMVRENNTWYMFFEVMNRRTHHADIGLATSEDGFHWAYQRIVLDEPFHLSYPYVFKWNGEYYMIPETRYAGSIRLYKATNFPTEWSFIDTLVDGEYRDSSIFYYDGKWWMTTATTNGVLLLFYADNLLGPWREHTKSPVINGNCNCARPGGRVLVLDDGRIIRYTQDDFPTYGNQVRAFEITKLTVADYEEEEVSESPILKKSGTGWNGFGMHNIDPHKINEENWIAVVDGYGGRRIWGFGY